jgi:hypothetical protein
MRSIELARSLVPGAWNSMASSGGEAMPSGGASISGSLRPRDLFDRASSIAGHCAHASAERSSRSPIAQPGRGPSRQRLYSLQPYSMESSGLPSEPGMPPSTFISLSLTLLGERAGPARVARRVRCSDWPGDQPWPPSGANASPTSPTPRSCSPSSSRADRPAARTRPTSSRVQTGHRPHRLQRGRRGSAPVAGFLTVSAFEAALRRPT